MIINNEEQGYYTCTQCGRENCYGNPDYPVFYACHEKQPQRKLSVVKPDLKLITGAGIGEYYQCPQRVRVISQAELPLFIAGMPHVRSVWWDVVHNSASPISTYQGLSTWQGFQSYHIHGRGWRDIGYHFGVGPDGQVFLGRGITITGAHAYTQGNTGSIGICMIGNFDREDPTPVQVSMFVRLATMLGAEFGYNGVVNDYLRRIGTGEHSGHRWADWHGTSCPGMRVTYPELQTWFREIPPQPIPIRREEEDMFVTAQKMPKQDDLFVWGFADGANQLGWYDGVHTYLNFYNENKTPVKVHYWTSPASGEHEETLQGWSRKSINIGQKVRDAGHNGGFTTIVKCKSENLVLGVSVFPQYND